MTDDAEIICRKLAAGEDAASLDLTESQRNIFLTALAIWRSSLRHHDRHLPTEALVGSEVFSVLMALIASECRAVAAALKSAEPTEPLTCQAGDCESAKTREQPELCESAERHEEAHNTACTDMREPVERDVKSH